MGQAAILLPIASCQQIVKLRWLAQGWLDYGIYGCLSTNNSMKSPYKHNLIVLLVPTPFNCFPHHTIVIRVWWYLRSLGLFIQPLTLCFSQTYQVHFRQLLLWNLNFSDLVVEDVQQALLLHDVDVILVDILWHTILILSLLKLETRFFTWKPRNLVTKLTIQILKLLVPILDGLQFWKNSPKGDFTLFIQWLYTGNWRLFSTWSSMTSKSILISHLQDERISKGSSKT